MLSIKQKIKNRNGGLPRSFFEIKKARESITWLGLYRGSETVGVGRRGPELVGRWWRLQDRGLLPGGESCQDVASFAPIKHCSAIS